MPDSQEKLTIFLKRFFVRLESIGPLLPLLNLDSFVLFNSLLHNPQFVCFEFLQVFLNELVPFFIGRDQLFCGVDVVNCYPFLVLLVVCANNQAHIGIISPLRSHWTLRLSIILPQFRAVRVLNWLLFRLIFLLSGKFDDSLKLFIYPLEGGLMSSSFRQQFRYLVLYEFIDLAIIGAVNSVLISKLVDQEWRELLSFTSSDTVPIIFCRILTVHKKCKLFG